MSEYVPCMKDHVSFYYRSNNKDVIFKSSCDIQMLILRSYSLKSECV